jgi:phosphoserine phosphatase
MMKKFMTIFSAAVIITCCTACASKPSTTQDPENPEIPESSENSETSENFLASWNADAPALDTLTGYVETVTDPESSDYIPPEDRIAVFDVDGTLFPEQNPTYLADYLLAHRLLTDPSYGPDDEMLEFGRMLRDHMLDGDFPDYVVDEFDETYNRAFAGMTLAEFDDFVARMLAREADGFEGMTYAEACYDPMVEVIDYLQKNDFEVFLCSGNDRLVCRTLAREGNLNIPQENIIGTDVVLQVVQGTASDPEGMTQAQGDYEAGDSVIRTEQAIVYNYKINKVTQIAQEIGRRPVLSFGNGGGDVSMLNYTICDNPYKSLAFMLLADDDVRDYGTAGEELRERWESSGYQVISMEQDWQTIYGEDVVKTGSFHWLEDLSD